MFAIKRNRVTIQQHDVVQYNIIVLLFSLFFVVSSYELDCNGSTDLVPMHFQHGELNPSTIIDNNQNPTNVQSCMGSPNGADTADETTTPVIRGIWYRMIGTGNVFTASACSQANNNDAPFYLSVFMDPPSSSSSNMFSVGSTRDNNNNNNNNNDNNDECMDENLVCIMNGNSNNNNNNNNDNENNEEGSSSSSSACGTMMNTTTTRQSLVTFRTTLDREYYIFVHDVSTMSKEDHATAAITNDDSTTTSRAGAAGSSTEFFIVLIEEIEAGRQDSGGGGGGGGGGGTIANAANAATTDNIPPFNDRCANAMPLDLLQLGYGSTESATVDYISNCGGAQAFEGSPGVWFSVQGTGGLLRASTCEYSNFDTQLSVFVAADSTATLTRDEELELYYDCNDADRHNSLASNSDNTRQLQCVDGNDDSCGTDGKQSTLSWSTEPDTTYYILLHGYDVESGRYSLVVSAAQPTPENNDCTRAVPVQIGDTERGNTVSATLDEVIPKECGDASVEGVGVWYTILGTGGSLTVSTCSFANFDTQISVYREAESSTENNSDGSNGCEIALECVDGNDDDNEACRNRSTLSWGSRYNTMYYIYVHGWGGQTGNFDIAVTGEVVEDVVGNGDDGVVAIEDGCHNAIPIEPGIVQDGSITSSSSSSGEDIVVPACGDATAGNRAGMWYTVMGTGTLLRAHTCGSSGGSASSTLDTQISVFSMRQDNNNICNDTSDLVCIDGNDNWCEYNSAVRWQSQPNTLYYIYVFGNQAARSGFLSPVGDFSLMVEILQPPFPQNSYCNLALPTTVGGEKLMGNTTLAIPSSVQSCHGDSEFSSSTSSRTGLWYKVQGTGRTMVASTCVGSGDNNGDDETTISQNDIDGLLVSFDTEISVFEGSCAGSDGDSSTLSCLVSNDDACGPQSMVTWNSNAEMTYYIFVHGYGTTTGSFHLSVREEAPAVPEVNDPNETARTTANNCNGAIPIELQVIVPSPGQLQEQQQQQEEQPEQEVRRFQEPYSKSDILYGSTTSSHVTFNEHDIATTCSNNNVGNDNSTATTTLNGVWYSVRGTGSPMVASTCDSSLFDTQLSIYMGICSSDEIGLICVNSNDDDCGTRSAIRWHSQLSVTYYILVHGYENQTGDYSLLVESIDGKTNNSGDGGGDDASMEIAAATTSSTMKLSQGPPPPPKNDICSDAFSLVPLPFFSGASSNQEHDNEVSFASSMATDAVMRGSTVSASVKRIQACGSATEATAPGVWYKVIGNGNVLKVIGSTCSNYNLQISVHTGHCNYDHLICVNGSMSGHAPDDEGFSLFSCQEGGLAAESRMSGGAETASSSELDESTTVVYWNSEVDAIYYVYVHGEITSSGEASNTMGEFHLVVQDLGAPGGGITDMTDIANVTDDSSSSSACSHSGSPFVFLIILLIYCWATSN